LTILQTYHPQGHFREEISLSSQRQAIEVAMEKTIACDAHKRSSLSLSPTSHTLILNSSLPYNVQLR
ncbi:MAG: hypothetical protein F6K22_33540, partial [Okeania sp. SIO2F4]|uniref:hypothetical protein n=1 Tax=Okeania sp. SIO2F4 TaxID=2607790 RepID=UPI00142D07F9